MTIQHKLLIGAFGWQYPQWQDSFYPEDLPEDWQLSYYANEFRVLMIPSIYVDKHNHKSMSFFDELTEGNAEFCHLLFELPLRNDEKESNDEYFAHLEDLMARLSEHRDCCLGVIYPILQSELHQQEYYETLFQICTKVTTLSVEMPADMNADLLPEKYINLAAQYGVNACRLNAQQPLYRVSSELTITFCSAVDLSPRELRSVVENSLCSTAVSPSANVLIFRSNPPQIGQMHNAAIISDLL